MTEQELAVLERLWRGSMPIKQIARRMGYSADTIRVNTARHRERFPKRRKSFTQQERDQWADRALGGMDAADVARSAEVAVSTINRWARERRAAS
jgi:transposase